MLINQIGIESDEDIESLDNRRPVPDPKNRETITALLKISLSPVTRAERFGTATRVDATVTTVVPLAPEIDRATHTDVA